MTGIQLENVTKTFGSFVALEEMSLTIPDGAFCVFLGPSGCGKSTTLNLIAGLDEVTSGQISIGGRDVTDLAPHERDIAMVFQSSLLYPHLSAIDNIKMSLKNTSLSSEESQKRIDYAVGILNIESELAKKPGAMSGGQRQRVAMAKAIVRQPSAFLMDEPLAALDAALRQSLRVELVAMQKQLETTTVFVTHDQIEAMTMGDMIVVMNEGRIEQVGSPQEVYEHPATRFVAGFIGSPQMNFIAGHIRMSGDDILFEGQSGTVALAAHLKDQASNGPMELCVRPENMSLERKETAGMIKAQVFAVENLGKESIVIVKSNAGEELRAIMTPQHDFRIGETAFIRPDTSQAHLFSINR